MKAKFGEVKNINFVYQPPPVGQFALEPEASKPIVWDHCREQFLGKMTSEIKGFYFSNYYEKSEDVASFVAKFENILAVSHENFILSNFNKTDKDNILWISPSRFWFDCMLKKSLFTLVLRASLNYDIKIDNFENCFFGEFQENKLIKETKTAFIRFMYGFTKYTGKLPENLTNSNSTLIRHGWHSEFNFVNYHEIKNKLISPFRSVNDNYFGFDFLWN